MLFLKLQYKSAHKKSFIVVLTLGLSIIFSTAYSQSEVLVKQISHNYTEHSAFPVALYSSDTAFDFVAIDFDIVELQRWNHGGMVNLTDQQSYDMIEQARPEYPFYDSQFATKEAPSNTNTVLILNQPNNATLESKWYNHIVQLVMIKGDGFQYVTRQ